MSTIIKWYVHKSTSISLSNSFTYLCAHVDTGAHLHVRRRVSEQARATGHAWKSEHHPQGQSFYFTTWLLVETQVIGLGRKHLYLLNHPAGPIKYLYSKD